MKVLIATPFYGPPPTHYVMSLVNTLQALSLGGVQWEMAGLLGDTYVQRARNAILYQFLNSDCDTLFLIDSDIAWLPEGFAKVLTCPKPACAPLYPMKNEWKTWTGAHMTQDGEPIREGEYVKAVRLPTGFMKMDRDVAQRLWDAEPEWYYGYDGTVELKHVFTAGPRADHLWWTEDFTMCEKWRALGGELWMAPDVTLRHMYTYPHEGNYGEFLNTWSGPGAEDEAA